MNRLNRRRFMALSSAGVASAVLVACGNESASDVELNPTMIPDVAGAPPTLAPMASPPSTGSGGEQAAGEGQADSGGGSASVSAFEMGFDPAELQVAPGDTITMTNDGVLEHDFTVDEWGGVLIGPFMGGESGETTVPEDAAVGDTFTFYCSIPGHREAGMEGTLTIVEAGAAAASGEEGATPEDGAAAAGGAIEQVDVSASEMLFDPAEFEVTPGTKIVVTNDGMLEHDFAIDDLGGVLVGPLAGGESGEYTVPDDAEVGTAFEFYCSIPGHKESGMVGTMTVVEAGAGGGEAAAAGEGEASPEAEAATPAAGGGETIEQVDLSAFEMGFEPAEFEVTPGTKIALTNDGMLEHDFAVDAWGGVVIGPLAGGDAGEYTVPDDVQPGETLDFYCSVPGHKESGMTGKLTVVEAGAGGGGAAAGGEEEATPAASPAAAGGESSGGNIAEAEVSATEMLFEPAEFEVSAGTVIKVANDGVLEHDFAVDDWGGVVVGPLAGGESGEYTVPDDVESGATIEFYCSIPGHKESGMTGTMTVV